MSEGTSSSLDPAKAHMLTRPWHSFGQTFNGLAIFGRPARFPVVNERAVRATAGIMMALGAVAIAYGYFEQNFVPVRIISILFVVDYAIRQVAGLTPLSPIGVLGTLLVSNQRPEWVGASQKRFAWALGLIMAICIAVLSNLGLWPSLTLFIGITLIALLWLESVVGACMGCLIYSILIKLDLIHPEDAPACGGNACEVSGARA